LDLFKKLNMQYKFILCIYMQYKGFFFLFYCIFSIFFVPLWPEILPLPVFIK